jgi:glucose 1-dehydrogenase
MTGRLEGRTAIVTGAASGLGRAIARKFAAEGAAVVISDVRETPLEGGEPTEALIAEQGGSVLSVPGDQASWDHVDALVSATVERFGRLDVMVPNAAISDGKELTESDAESWDRIMSVNLRGVFFCLKGAVQQMLIQEPLDGDEARGRIVNISSQHGMVCSPGEFSYGVSKAGVAYMTRQIAVDYAERGIVCNAVAPGKILTGRADGMNKLEYSRSRTPFPRLGRPEDIANAATFLASPEASYMTGHNLMVDGGWMAY